MTNRPNMVLLAGALLAALGGCDAGDDGFLDGQELDDASELLASRYQLTAWDNSNTDYRTTISAVVNIRRDASGASLVARPCAASLPSVLAFTPTLAEQGIQKVRVDAPLRVWSSGLRTDTAIMEFGVELDDDSSAVPSDPRDPQVVDDDGDGKPGISILVGLGRKVYAGIRVDLSLEGTFSDPEVIAGRAPMAIDRQIYGDNIPFFDARATAEDENSLGRSSVRGYFEMTALNDASDPLSCHDVR